MALFRRVAQHSTYVWAVSLNGSPVRLAVKAPTSGKVPVGVDSTGSRRQSMGRDDRHRACYRPGRPGCARDTGRPAGVIWNGRAVPSNCLGSSIGRAAREH
jgi:hypothetical protein